MERKLRVYIETSIISHLDAPDRPDRMGETLLLWQEIQAGKYEIVIGDPVMTELERCHEPKRTFMLKELEKIVYDLVSLTDDSTLLADTYTLQGGLPRKSIVDARHIALATVAGCDVILSWNFTHIVNIKAMATVNRINALENRKLVQLVSPSTFLEGVPHEQAYE